MDAFGIAVLEVRMNNNGFISAFVAMAGVGAILTTPVSLAEAYAIRMSSVACESRTTVYDGAGYLPGTVYSPTYGLINPFATSVYGNFNAEADCPIPDQYNTSTGYYQHHTATLIAVDFVDCSTSTANLVNVQACAHDPASNAADSCTGWTSSAGTTANGWGQLPINSGSLGNFTGATATSDYVSVHVSMGTYGSAPGTGACAGTPGYLGVNGYLMSGT